MNNLRKIVGHVVSSELSDDELQKRARAAQLSHTVGDHPNRRIEVGEVETTLGRLRFAHSMAENSIAIHGVEAPLSVIDRDLRRAIEVSSAAFAAAQDSSEQADQRAVISAVVDTILRRHTVLAEKVKDRVIRERFDS